MPPEPARPLRAEASSDRWPEKIFWQLHSAKGNSPRAANHSPNAPRIEKATQAVFAPGPPLSIERTGAGLPRLPGPSGLLGVPVPETHSPQVLLRGETGLGARRPSAPRPQTSPLSQFLRSGPRYRRTDAPHELLRAAFCKGKLSSGSKPQPQRASDRESNASRFRPRPPALHRANRGWAAPAPWALLLCWGSPCPKPTPHRVFFVGKQDWAREGRLRPGPRQAP